MARPTKLTPERQERIVKAIQMGNYANIAARASGIAPGTFFAWMAKGKKAKSGKYYEFYDAIKKAESEAELVKVNRITLASSEHWQAAAWYLERKHYDRWGKKDRHEVTGADGGPIQEEVVIMTEEERERRIRAIVAEVGTE